MQVQQCRLIRMQQGLPYKHLKSPHTSQPLQHWKLWTFHLRGDFFGYSLSFSPGYESCQDKHFARLQRDRHCVLGEHWMLQVWSPNYCRSMLKMVENCDSTRQFTTSSPVFWRQVPVPSLQISALQFEKLKHGWDAPLRIIQRKLQRDQINRCWHVGLKA